MSARINMHRDRIKLDFLMQIFKKPMERFITGSLLKKVVDILKKESHPREYNRQHEGSSTDNII